MNTADRATRAQIIMLVDLWNKAKSILHPKCDAWSTDQDRQHRVEFASTALNRRIDSFSDLNKRRDVDDLKGALLAVTQPDDLDAQLRQVRGADRRARHGVESLMRQLQVGTNYVQTVIDRMTAAGDFVTGPDASDAERDTWQRERERGQHTHKTIDDLTEPQLRKLVGALKRTLAARQNKKTRVYKLDAQPRMFS